MNQTLHPFTLTKRTIRQKLCQLNALHVVSGVPYDTTELYNMLQKLSWNVADKLLQRKSNGQITQEEYIELLLVAVFKYSA